jgi:CRISPR/Cas system-associated exonuclease Cas4 (RecB family)
MRVLSKSKLLAYRQCHRRLWLEERHPELNEDVGGTQQTFEIGHQVGDVARRLYDPEDKGVLVDSRKGDIEASSAQTRDAIKQSTPVFEAGFTAGGVSAFSDIVLPVKRTGELAWRIVDVKSSTKLKDYYRDDVAVQAFVARAAGLRLDSISIAHIDSAFVYEGDGDYDGLLVESNLTAETFKRHREVQNWVAEAQSILEGQVEPSIRTGRHCSEPYECGFQRHCRSGEPQARYPASLLPHVQAKALRAFLDQDKVVELQDIPDELLNERQRLVKSHTLADSIFFDRAGATADLAPHRLPAYFLDFETIQFTVPIWKGTRPYQQIPFQFSVHVLPKNELIEHYGFREAHNNYVAGHLSQGECLTAYFGRPMALVPPFLGT